MKTNLIFICLMASIHFQSCLSVAADDIAAQPSALPAPRTKLWDVIQDCVSDINSDHSPQGPCFTLPGTHDVRGGVLVLKDIKAPAHFLLVPTTPVSGIEDPQVLSDGSPDYWGAAWAARGFVGSTRQKDIPEHFLGFAANPKFARSQDQLHIHIDCVFPDVIATLNAAYPSLNSVWSENTIVLHGAAYHVLFVPGDDLKDIRPFKLLERNLSSGDTMGQHTIGVIKADPKVQKGFYLLERGRTLDDTQTRVHAEDLLDMSCGVIGN